MRHRAPLLLATALLMATACASSGGQKNWTARQGAQPFETAYTVCREASYGIEANFITCMAGRGWVRNAR
ncbi:hypothetical protein [Hyphomonas sp.]|uniref:hypothetical protein n=1 Tax=Hyphomonas sp. TaxID=87 RepID=UPI00391B98D5